MPIGYGPLGHLLQLAPSWTGGTVTAKVFACSSHKLDAFCCALSQALKLIAPSCQILA